MPAKSGIIASARSSGRCARARGARRRRRRRRRAGGGLPRVRRPAARTPADRASCRRSGACLLRYSSARLLRAATIRDWILPATRLSRMPPSDSISRNSSQAASHSALRQRLDAAGTGSGIGHEIDMAFLRQDELRVAGDAAREAVGQPVRDAVRQDRHRIGAAGSGRKAGDGGAQDVGLGVLCRHHAVGRFDMDARR